MDLGAKGKRANHPARKSSSHIPGGATPYSVCGDTKGIQVLLNTGPSLHSLGHGVSSFIV